MSHNLNLQALNWLQSCMVLGFSMARCLCNSEDVAIHFSRFDNINRFCNDNLIIVINDFEGIPNHG